MSTHWDRSVDLLIAGSGGGGMVAGLAALDCGLEPLMIEKQGLVGGSTGLSGGIVWLPNNPLMRADGIADSHEDGLAYLAMWSATSVRLPRPRAARCSSPRATR